MSRRVSLPVALAGLVAVGAVTALVTRSVSGPREPAPASPHAPVAGFEPSAANVSQELMGRLHALEKKVETDGADTAALLELARLLHDAHRPAEAAARYARYLAVNPENREAWFDLADAHGRAGDWAAARSAMEALLAKDAGDPAVLYNLGVIAVQSGDPAGARTWWEKAAAQSRDGETARRARESLASLGGR